jgi:hypothetical protein
MPASIEVVAITPQLIPRDLPYFWRFSLTAYAMQTSVPLFETVVLKRSQQRVTLPPIHAVQALAVVIE